MTSNPGESYREFQFANLIFAVAIPVQILQTYLYLNHLGNNPMGLNSFVISNLIFVCIYLLFFGMTTKVDKERLFISYGIGLIRKKIDLDQIQHVTIVKNPWYYGWGIRLIPHGMLYNIGGSGGIELKLKETASVIRIGSADPIRLKEEIQKQLRG